MVGIGIDVSAQWLDVARSDTGDAWRHANSVDGIVELLARLLDLREVRVVMEATGGFEQGVLDACTATGLWTCRVNPRQARAYAQAIGPLAKTDRIDARVLAQMHSLPQLRAHVPPEAWRTELAAWVTRRGQVVTAVHQQRQQLARLPAAVRDGAGACIAALCAERDTIDRQLRRLMQPRLSAALSGMKGVGPVLQATLLARLPELGRLDQRKIAKLVGVAPLNCDSGQHRGQRHIWGGRRDLRTVLYMAALSAMRWEPAIRAFHDRLRARGKAGKVVVVACMHKMLTILNARRRDELRAECASG